MQLLVIQDAVLAKSLFFLFCPKQIHRPRPRLYYSLAVVGFFRTWLVCWCCSIGVNLAFAVTAAIRWRRSHLDQLRRRGLWKQANRETFFGRCCCQDRCEPVTTPGVLVCIRAIVFAGSALDARTP